ncbi:MAG: 6-carboxytetrahydropterin synthase [Saccharofermentans sp.]|nr:6-carboxytetrahydropterin synthase [Saccharofermentans sp.]
MNRLVKLEYRFNASHSISGARENEHVHTFTMTATAGYEDDSKEQETDEVLRDFVKGFENRYLNDLEYFEGAYPSIEEMGDRFYETLHDELMSKGIKLMSIEISDNPMTSYSVSDRIMGTCLNDNVSTKNYNMLLKYRGLVLGEEEL